jgi:DNA primase
VSTTGGWTALIDTEAVKSRVSLEDAFRFLGIDLPPSNRHEFKILCPVHEERHASCSVWPGKNHWHCFGCHVGGDIFSLVMAVKKVDFAEAAKQLAELAGVEGSERPQPTAPSKSPSALFREASDVAHAEIVELAKRRTDYPEGCFEDYDEIERIYRVDEISATEALREILNWRRKWKAKLA